MDNCVFCKISSGKIPTNRIYETENVLVFPDLHPKANTHLLIIPKEHLENLFYATEQDKLLLGELMQTASILAEKLQISVKGFKLIVRNGRNAGQEIDHLHLHFLSD